MRDLYFFIGTEAEIMKMFMVINKAKEAGFCCKVISSGQNDISHSPFMELCDSKIDVDFSIYMPKKKGSGSYLQWLVKTIQYGVKYMKNVLKNHPVEQQPIMVIHGNTLSTLMGAIIARRSGMRHVHVEGGLRSYHWFNPFPEEIDRYFGSKYADIVFCPSAAGIEIVKKSFHGEGVSTEYNTNIETLGYAYKAISANPIPRIYEGKYFVVALHRQENLLSREFMTEAVKSIVELSSRIHCLFIYHQQTADTLEKFGLMDEIQGNPNITVVKRLAYLNFIDAVDKAEFMVADGAGNQQELYYMGKPYLIMRKHIESDSEGLGYNCIGFNNDFELVRNFDREYLKYKHDRISPKVLPSDIIVSKLVEKYS